LNYAVTIPLWKKWLSHLFPLTLESSGSALNPELSVLLDRGRLQLLSGNAIYSWDDLYHNFLLAFDDANISERPIKDVLLLGLGLGSVPYMLEKVFGLECRITAVEIDETVAELAMRYSLHRLDNPVDVVTADAGIFVEVCEEMFDLIVIDIFEDDKTPEQFERLDFLEICRDMLNPGGLLMYNRLYREGPVSVSTDRFYNDVFLKTFPEGKALDTKGNWVLVGENTIDE